MPEKSNNINISIFLLTFEIQLINSVISKEL